MGSLSPSLSLLVPQILNRYDVVLVQEVRDSDLSAVTQLMEQLNRYELGWGTRLGHQHVWKAKLVEQ